MILEIQHETRFTYPEPVTEAVAEVRMEPASDADQSCRSFHLTVGPPTGLHRYSDGFGNRVHHFNLLAPHREARVLSASVVETHPRSRNLPACRATWPLAPDVLGLDALDFLQFRGPVRQTTLLEPVLAALRPLPGTPLAEVVMGVSRHIHTHYEYARDVTSATT